VGSKVQTQLGSCLKPPALLGSKLASLNQHARTVRLCGRGCRTSRTGLTTAVATGVLFASWVRSGSDVIVVERRGILMDGVIKPVRGWIVLAGFALVASLVATLPPAQAAVSTAGSLSAAPAQGIAGETLKLTGNLPPQRSRPVVLQRGSGSSWVQVTAGNTNTLGRFAFATKVRNASTTYRVFAPRTTLAGKAYPALVTPTTTVKTQTQSGSLSLASTAQAGQAVTATATFVPVRSGRPVVFQVLAATNWTQVAAGSESLMGKTTFSVPTGVAGSFTYRAVAQPYKGAAAVATAAHTIQVSDPTPIDTTPPPVPSSLAAGARRCTCPGSRSQRTTSTDTSSTGDLVRRAHGPSSPEPRHR